MAMYQLNYGAPVGEPPPNPNPLTQPQLEDPTPPQPQPSGSTGAFKRKAPAPAQWFEEDETRNSKVYVSNLPSDITDQEFVDVMQKCGLVMKDEKNNFKIKLYENEDGSRKGDGLCTYIKIESVDLALTILDGYQVRPGHPITVERAKFELKGQYDPSKKPRQKKKKDKLKMKEKQEKLFEWKPEKIRGTVTRPKFERIVIVSNAFDPIDFDRDVSAILEFQEDFREEAGKCGICKKVVIHDRHPDGVVQIFMGSAEEADKVVLLFNGRFFGGRKIAATLYDGKAKFNIEETEEEREERLKNWEKHLEEEEKANADAKNTQNNGSEPVST